MTRRRETGPADEVLRFPYTWRFAASGSGCKRSTKDDQWCRFRDPPEVYELMKRPCDDVKDAHLLGFTAASLFNRPMPPPSTPGVLRRGLMHRAQRNPPTYPGSAAISTSRATALARRIWRGVRQRTLSNPGLATTSARQRALLVATFRRFRL